MLMFVVRWCSESFSFLSMIDDRFPELNWFYILDSRLTCHLWNWCKSVSLPCMLHAQAMLRHAWPYSLCPHAHATQVLCPILHWQRSIENVETDSATAYINEEKEWCLAETCKFFFILKQGLVQRRKRWRIKLALEFSSHTHRVT